MHTVVLYMCVSCACDGAFGGRFSVENRVVGAYKGQIFPAARAHEKNVRLKGRIFVLSALFGFL